MISNRFIIYAYLCLIIIRHQQTQGDSPNTKTENLVDEYYTAWPTITDKFIPQDDIDAQAILDSDKDQKVMASIFAYRDKMRRYAISQRISQKNDKIAKQTKDTQAKIKRWDYWFDEKYYKPQEKGQDSTKTFMDLCFGLIFDENTVLANYFENFFFKMDETWITIGIVLTKDTWEMIKTFEKAHYCREAFKTARNDQRKPFKNMLRVWVKQNRELIEKELNSDDVKQNANTLKAEQDDGCWREKRDQIEMILIRKSIKYARTVIQQFEMANGGTAMEDIIGDCVQKGKLNHDLGDTYASLALYIKDKYKYIAKILRSRSDGSDKWAAWILCIAVVHPKEWPKVDEAFRKDQNDVSLSEFILKKLAKDEERTMAELIATIVDPKFQPSKFSEKSAQNVQPQGNPTFTPTPPPVPPTLKT